MPVALAPGQEYQRRVSHDPAPSPRSDDAATTTSQHSPSPDASGGEPEELSDAARRRILGVLLVPLFMSLISVSIVNVTLSSIQQDLHASASALQWVLTGYALAFGVLLVASGRAGDVFGRRKLFVGGIAVFAGASLLCGLAPSTTVLNIGRVVQGLGSGMLNPQTVGMIQQYFRGRERARAFGLFGSVVGVAVAIGPTLGGLLIQVLGPGTGWRAAFLVNVPIAVLAIVLAMLWLPRQRRRPGRVDMDPVGVGVFGVAVLALLLPFVEARVSPWIWLSLPAGLLLLWAWVRWERRYKTAGGSPMVDLELFRTASFSYGSLLISIYFLGVTSVWIVVAMYAQQGLGRTALEAGTLGLPASVLSAVIAPLSGRAVLRWGRTVVVVGMGVALSGILLSVLVAHGMSHWGWPIACFYASLAFIGAGQGAVMAPNQTLSFADVPLKFAGAAGGVLQTGQRMGTAIGTALITAVTFAVLELADWNTAFAAAFGVIALVVLLAMAVAVADGRRRTAASRT